jgi:hypothetical protein
MTNLEHVSPTVIACDKRKVFAQGSKATKQSIYRRAQKDGLLHFARNDATTPQEDQDCNDAITAPSHRAADVHSPEMAHFFAQNIIAPYELFSEN